VEEAEMRNPFVHVELVTTDVKKSKAFYRGLFNWRLDDIPGLDYTMIKVGEGAGGGMIRHPIPQAPAEWIAYVEVEDVAAATEKATSLGATVLKPVTEVEHVGSFSIIIDPTGAALAMWQPAEPAVK
jgi:uncharacterized protein